MPSWSRWHEPGQAPHWWPQGEPWPPLGPPWRWRKMRGRFIWRLVILLTVFLVFLFTVLGVLGWLASRKFGGPPPFDGPHLFFRPFGFLFMLLLVLGIIAAVRAIRGTATPVGDVIEAAGRLAGGDYTVRVIERGPPEVQDLARSFNQMAGRLQTHEEQRRNLLADVTHELRTPLAVIQGNLEGLLDGVYPRDDAHLAPVLEETRILSTLIEDLRTLALAETGALHLELEPTDLEPLIQDTVAAFRTQAGAAVITITAESDPGLPEVLIDSTRIRQVLANLVTNALQHTPAGGSVKIECRAGADGGTVSISVTDTGRGIASQDLPHIFDRFYKARDSRGSGLGLAIARNLVVLHGGEITAISEIGKGTTITFSLPVRPAAA